MDLYYSGMEYGIFNTFWQILTKKCKHLLVLLARDIGGRKENTGYRKFQHGTHVGEWPNPPLSSTSIHFLTPWPLYSSGSTHIGCLLVSCLFWFQAGFAQWETLERHGRESEGDSEYFSFTLDLRWCLWQQWHLFWGSICYKAAPSWSLLQQGKLHCGSSSCWVASTSVFWYISPVVSLAVGVIHLLVVAIHWVVSLSCLAS